MLERINYLLAAPEAIDILLNQEKVLHKHFREIATLGVTILELVKLRVSQINGCAFCLDMHSAKAFELGETHDRVIALNGWQDSPLFTKQERHALAFTELLVAGQDVNDVKYEEILATFGESGLAYLTIAINAISSWNRIVKVFKPKVGSYP